MIQILEVTHYLKISVKRQFMFFKGSDEIKDLMLILNEKSKFE